MAEKDEEQPFEPSDWYTNRDERPPDRSYIADHAERAAAIAQDHLTLAQLHALPVDVQGPVSRNEMVLRVLDAIEALEGWGFSEGQVKDLSMRFKADLSLRKQPFDTDGAVRQALKRARDKRSMR